MDGHVTLWRSDRSIRELCPGTSQKAIEAWAQAYDEGRHAGVAEGRALGRAQLATEFRTLIRA